MADFKEILDDSFESHIRLAGDDADIEDWDCIKSYRKKRWQELSKVRVLLDDDGYVVTTTDGEKYAVIIRKMED